MNSPSLTLSDIREALGRHHPLLLAADRPQAAVAMLLCEADPVTEALFIVRAKHNLDPWSGDIGFPGGRVAKGDVTPRHTAERETAEELSFDLARANYLGRLDDLYGVTLPILVSCFIYASSTPRPCLLENHEVAASFWIPLDQLLDPSRHRVRQFPYRGSLTSQPAIDLLGPGKPLLWGITYRLLHNFFGILDRQFGPPQS